jgi:hypothetical protein
MQKYASKIRNTPAVPIQSLVAMAELSYKFLKRNASLSMKRLQHFGAHRRNGGFKIVR